MKRFLFYSATNKAAVSDVLAGIGVIKLRLVRAGLYLLLVLAAGTIGYSIIGQGEWNLLDCLYMTVITLTTVGYDEVLPINDVAGGRAFTIAIIIIGMGLVLYFVSTMTAFFVDGSLGALFSEKRMRKKLEALKGHIIVCGVGKTLTLPKRHLSRPSSDSSMMCWLSPFAHRVPSDMSIIPVPTHTCPKATCSSCWVSSMPSNASRATPRPGSRNSGKGAEQI